MGLLVSPLTCPRRLGHREGGGEKASRKGYGALGAQQYYNISVQGIEM